VLVVPAKRLTNVRVQFIVVSENADDLRILVEQLLMPCGVHAENEDALELFDIVDQRQYRRTRPARGDQKDLVVVDARSRSAVTTASLVE
jgi:hypothetical protein